MSRPVWVRVRDLRTDHQYDVTEQRLELLLKRGTVEELPDRRHRGTARPPKFSRPMGSITPNKAAQPEAEAVAEEKESESQ